MKNFAEEITYWYFRLNGFFLLENYVSHKSETKTSSYADNDIIGIKPQHITEIIGLLNHEDICINLKKVIPEINNKMIGIICEVKGGETNVASLNETKIKSCINRLGIIQKTKIEEVQEKLKTNSSYSDENVSIHKIFVSVNNSTIPNWEKIQIETMLEFIKSRMKKYSEKGKAWNHYNSSLFQYLLYQQKEKPNG